MARTKMDIRELRLSDPEENDNYCFFLIFRCSRTRENLFIYLCSRLPNIPPT